MSLVKSLGINYGNAICYSGYREGQSPINHIYPTYDQVVQDLKILEDNWRLLRIYDCSAHAETVLEVIKNESLNFKVMLGADMRAEINNPMCPWHAEYSEDILRSNIQFNSEEIERLISFANKYSEIVFSVSVGNEATVEWSDHLVPVDNLITYVQRVKNSIKQPITFCENYVPWQNKLMSLAAELDFISIHTYPVWEYHTIEGAIEYTKQNYNSVARQYPDKSIVITEAGWTTKSNGRGIEAWNASQEFQAQYYSQLMDWSRDSQIIVFAFEAFDEPWKGSPDSHEPEKHWGMFTVDRKPKLVMKELYPNV